jgi:hypothetical protein
MLSAFKLQLSMASDDKVTELVGEKIIELAWAGEHVSAAGNPEAACAKTGLCPRH